MMLQMHCKVMAPTALRLRNRVIITVFRKSAVIGLKINAKHIHFIFNTTK